MTSEELRMRRAYNTCDEMLSQEDIQLHVKQMIL